MSYCCPALEFSQYPYQFFMAFFCSHKLSWKVMDLHPKSTKLQFHFIYCKFRRPWLEQQQRASNIPWTLLDDAIKMTFLKSHEKIFVRSHDFHGQGCIKTPSRGERCMDMINVLNFQSKKLTNESKSFMMGKNTIRIPS
jgi:hypothetical protein